LTWATLRRKPILSKPAAVKVSGFLTDYARGKGIYMVINYVNPEHTHALIDLPTAYSVEQVTKLLKGASSHWINQNRIIGSRFRWGRGYGAFSVSHSRLDTVARYIAGQEEHHRKRTFIDEYTKLMRAHELEWSEEDFE
jgi:REP element-mobilizing transposase RayT